MAEDQKAIQLSVADVSSAIALGLQRAISAQPANFKDRWLIYGGRLEFLIHVNPQGPAGPVQNLSELGQARG